MAYDKQKVIVKSREVDEAALAELKRALASTVIILIDFSAFMLHQGATH
jgi:5S rRNA maturation endonuclease (ribonuclease M5)